MEFGMLIAAENNSLDSAKILLSIIEKEDKKIINPESIKLSRKTCGGETPLHAAVRRHYPIL